MKQHNKLLLGFVLGVVIGLTRYYQFPASKYDFMKRVTDVLTFIGATFFRLIFMVVIPLIVSALMMGTIKLGRNTGLGCEAASGEKPGSTTAYIHSCANLPAFHPTHFRALRNMRIHGESSPKSLGCHDICTVRKTRSGCGIMIVKRPSGVVTPVIPCGEPFGLYG